jgi:hypothetical protein
MHDFQFVVLLVHNILQGRASRPFFTGKGASNSIQDPRHVRFLSTLNWNFVGRNSLHLLWSVLYSEETLRSLLKTLLKPLLTCYDQYYRRKKLCGVTLEATVEEGDPHSGLKKHLCIYKLSYTCPCNYYIQITIYRKHSLQSIQHSLKPGVGDLKPYRGGMCTRVPHGRGTQPIF